METGGSRLTPDTFIKWNPFRFFIHMSPSRTPDSDFTWVLPKGPSPFTDVERKMHMLNILHAGIFSPLMQMLLFRQVPTRQRRIHQSTSALCVTILFHTCNYPAAFGPRWTVSTHRGTFRKLLRMTVKISDHGFWFSEEKLLVFLRGVPRDGVLIRARQTGWS